MELTREEAVSRHRKMWRWIAEETEKRKRIVVKLEYFMAMKTKKKDIPFNMCYCCEYARLDEISCNCELCPILWDGIDNHCCKNGSSFRSWGDTCNWQVAAKAAKAIAELPERKENKYYE